LRAEWFSDPQGVRVDRANLNTKNAQGQTIPGLSRANYFEVTLGVNWRPTPNLCFRPEVRYDWDNGMGAATSRFDPEGGSYNKPDLWTFAFDAIWLY
jgi:hypothetical protein